jgi:Uma2 family endonuclease
LATKTLITAEEFSKLAPHLGRCELVRGEIIEMSPPGLVHGKITMTLGARLFNYVEEHNLGEVFAAETGFIVEHSTDEQPRDTVRGPDIAFVKKERIPEGGFDDAWGDFAPDLVVEVMSKNDTQREVLEKVGEYLDAGVRLVWVVRPQNKTVTIYRLNGGVEQLQADDTLDGEDVLPGFSCPVSDVFA